MKNEIIFDLLAEFARFIVACMHSMSQQIQFSVLCVAGCLTDFDRYDEFIPHFTMKHEHRMITLSHHSYFT